MLRSSCYHYEQQQNEIKVFDMTTPLALTVSNCVVLDYSRSLLLAGLLFFESLFLFYIGNGVIISVTTTAPKFIGFSHFISLQQQNTLSLIEGKCDFIGSVKLFCQHKFDKMEEVRLSKKWEFPQDMGSGFTHHPLGKSYFSCQFL